MVGALRALASFFGGRGFSVRKSCASASLVEASNRNTNAIVFNGTNGFMISFSFFERRVDFLEARIRKVKRAAEETPTGCESVYDDEFGKNCDSQSSQFVASPNRVQKNKAIKR